MGSSSNLEPHSPNAYSMAVQDIQPGRNQTPLVITTSKISSCTLHCELEERNCPWSQCKRAEIDWREVENHVSANAVDGSRWEGACKESVFASTCVVLRQRIKHVKKHQQAIGSSMSTVP